MTQTKIYWRRLLLMLLCALLLFSTILPVAAYAETGAIIIVPDEEEDDSSGGAAIIVPDNGEPTEVTISSSTVTSYFETNAFTGTWRDTGTPLHFINETGYIAYCLQTAMESPNNSSYSKVYWWDMYDSKTANGIFAIVTNGYPNNTGGFSTEEARYATANALRFWLGECGAEGAYDWMNLKTNPNNFRGKSGYEDLFDWCVDLVEIARAETDGMPSIELSPDTITLTKSGNYYVGSTTVKLYNCSGGYSVDEYTVPYGVEIEGSTGTNGGKISVKVPSSMAGESFTFCVDGINDDYEANLVYYAPNNGNEQHVVAYSPDPDAMSIYTSLTVNVPGTKVETDITEEVLTANISIAKMDGDTREYLAGAVIALYDADKNLVEKQTTNERGGVYFLDIPLGDYYLQEIEAPAGYVLNDRMMDICLDEEMVTYMRWLYNYKPDGSLTITKTDSSSGAVLSGAEYTIYDSSKNKISSGTTDSSGIVSFTELETGSYYYRETEAPSGYVLDSTYYPFTVTDDEPAVEVSRTNTKALGAVHITKYDRNTQETLEGVEFTLYDSSKTKLASNTTGEGGVLRFTNLGLGTYYIRETGPLPGYIANDSYNSFSITSNNQTVYKNIYNDRRTGTIHVTKKDNSGNPLSGAEYTLESSTDSGSTWTELGRLTTGSTGEVSFSDLDADMKTIYRLTETKAPEGFSLITESVFVGTLPMEVSSDAEFEDCEEINGTKYCYSIYVNVTDCPVFRLPNTGSCSELLVFSAAVLCLSVAVFMFFRKRRGTVA